MLQWWTGCKYRYLYQALSSSEATTTGREKMSCMGKTRVVNGNRICFLGSETAAIRLTCLIWSEMSHSDLSFRRISCGRPFQTNMPCYPLKGGMTLTVVIMWWSTNTFANVNWGDNLFNVCLSVVEMTFYAALPFTIDGLVFHYSERAKSLWGIKFDYRPLNTSSI